jgi:hypothetical protein
MSADGLYMQQGEKRMPADLPSNSVSTVKLTLCDVYLIDCGAIRDHKYSLYRLTLAMYPTRVVPGHEEPPLSSSPA